MTIENIQISNIPAILWGEKSSKIIIAVHGNMSSKSDAPIAILAEEVTPLGYQVVSFDLPEHGERKSEATLCKVQNCISDLEKIMEFAKLKASSISLMANSIGAYFSLLAYKEEPLKGSLLLSPVVDMERLIKNMMKWFDISEERLCKGKEISIPMGQILYWDYYQYVKNNKIEKWNVPTAILYGKNDEISEYESVLSFAKKFDSKLHVSDNSSHYFYTDEDLEIYRNWIRCNIVK